MQSIKLELKLNNKQRTKLAQHAGYSRFVYNYALALYNSLEEVIDESIGWVTSEFDACGQ
jgi:putative transposase